MGNDKKIPELIVNSSLSCFFCYDEIANVKHRPLLFSLKSVCRLLGVNLSKKTLSLKNGEHENESLSLPSTSGKGAHGHRGEVQVKVSLCEGCWLISGRFSRLYRELDAVRMKLGICLEAIDKKIMGADKNRELVEGYRRKLERNPEAKRHSRIVAELRKEIMLKYQSYSKRSQPRVKIKKSDAGGRGPPTITSKKESDLHRINLLRKILSRKENGKVGKVAVTRPIPTLLSIEPEGHISLPPQSPEEIIMVDDEDIEDLQMDQNQLPSNPKEDKGGAMNPEPGPVNPNSHPLNQHLRMLIGRTSGIAYQKSPSSTSSINTPYSCDLCWSPFATKRDLGAHLTRFHATISELGKFTCDICHKSFVTGGHLQLHQEATHINDDCSSRPDSEKDELPNGKLIMAPPDIPTFSGGGDPSAVGPIAPKNVFQGVDLRSLLPNGDPNARLQSPSNSSSDQKASSSSSSSTATPFKPFNCQLCPKSFPTIRGLAGHVTRMHAGYPYKRKILSEFDCDICHKLFRTGTELRIHREAVHTGLFICKYCDKECLSLDSLYNHNKIGCSPKKVSGGVNLNAQGSGKIPVVDIEMGEEDNPAKLCNNPPITIATPIIPPNPPEAPVPNFIPQPHPHLTTTTSSPATLPPAIFIMPSALVPAPAPQLAPAPPPPHRDWVTTKEGLQSHITIRHPDDPRLQTIFSGISQSSVSVVTNSSTSSQPNMQESNPKLIIGPPGEGLIYQYFTCPSCQKVFASQEWLSKHQRLHCQAPNRNGSLVLIGPSGPVTPTLGSTAVEDQNTLRFFRGDGDDNDQGNGSDPCDPSADTDDPAEPILEEVIDYDFDVKPGDDYAAVDPLA